MRKGAVKSGKTEWPVHGQLRAEKMERWLDRQRRRWFWRFCVLALA
jgi:hypothetical protein